MGLPPKDSIIDHASNVWIDGDGAHPIAESIDPGNENILEKIGSGVIVATGVGLKPPYESTPKVSRALSAGFVALLGSAVAYRLGPEAVSAGADLAEQFGSVINDRFLDPFNSIMKFKAR